MEVLAVLDDGTEIPLRGVTALRLETSAESPAVALVLRLSDASIDVEAPALEVKS
ncbi:hypothetical protein [Sorangium sp. So ce128]|uniref:hypothetical protein n=1 Tax=Sorangium sp. So ce128 TaxID=3133281 RepID=UPI003F61E5B9